MKRPYFLIAVLLLCMTAGAFGQSEPAEKDTTSKASSMSQKMEKLFVYIPAPIITYSTEAGNTFGLAKFNLFRLSKKDTLSRPSKISEVVTVSTKGRVNVSVSNDLIFNADKYMILSYFNFKKTPEYMLGIGNDVSIDNVEEVTIDRVKFYTSAMRKVAKDTYAGISLDVADYFGVAVDSNSFILEQNVTGKDGGTDFGLGFAAALDSRDNRYNAYKGALLLSTLTFYPKWLGSRYEFTSFYLDGRKYFNPWLKHVIAVQATMTYTTKNVPFYDLAMLGGEDRMRGYYKGALRDKLLIDTQVEYRMPIWGMFGLTTWVATGRVADKFSNFSLDGLWLSFGGGVRIRVDTKNNTNLRFDMGFGPNGVSGFYFNFAEAF
ncbi:MAG TPA: BamA/TamA family outer membrane protein [Chryseolinea sp.]